MKQAIKTLLNRIGVDIVRYNSDTKTSYPPDFTDQEIEIIEAVQGCTYTSHLRIQALCNAVRHINLNDIEGAIVECGVWKGGSMMAAALQLKQLGDDCRQLYLYDTYEGMSEPTEADVSILGKSAITVFDEHESQGTSMAHSSIEEVTENLEQTKYPMKNIHTIKGKVEDTIPNTVPEKIALLRLDTDWYESTLHELVHLYPRLTPGGILIIDDYGHWQGAKKAVDEYFATQSRSKPFLGRIDYTGRIIVKGQSE